MLGAAIARSVMDLIETGTLNQKTLKVAFMEFLMSADSNAMKRLWLQHGFRDISALWGDQPSVPTFRNDMNVISRWSEFQWEMQSCDADWYYLSGHHSRRHASDMGHSDYVDIVNQCRDVGFFNEPYHHGTWEDLPEEEGEVYMRMGEDVWDEVYEPTRHDNPLYGRVRSECKGVFLVGCNSLTYTHCRQRLVEYFPNAVVIGTLSTESNSISRILPAMQHYGKNFFLNPKSVDPMELCKRLNPFHGALDRMGVVSDDVLYYRGPGGFQIRTASDPWDSSEV